MGLRVALPCYNCLPLDIVLVILGALCTHWSVYLLHLTIPTPTKWDTDHVTNDLFSVSQRTISNLRCGSQQENSVPTAWVDSVQVAGTYMWIRADLDWKGISLSITADTKEKQPIVILLLWPLLLIKNHSSPMIGVNICWPLFIVIYSRVITWHRVSWLEQVNEDKRPTTLASKDSRTNQT